MKTYVYTVEVRETALHEVTVKAKSEMEAKRRAEYMAMTEECCLGDDPQCGDENVETIVVSKR